MPCKLVTALDRKETVLKEPAVQDLQKCLRGCLLRPCDDGYDGARKVWNDMIDNRPGLIARCTGVSDVMNSVNFACDNDLLVSVRAGGHNIAGKAVCNGGLMIDLTPMKGIRVDPVRRTAVAEAGVLLGEFDHETQAFGLATTSGVVTTTGIGGLTLGGGEGRLGRKYGHTCDNLLSADVVTADGRFLRASAEENQDLFWGLRGGGGNFGIVTSLEYQLYPVGPVVLAGGVVYPIEQAGEALKFYHEFSSLAPDDLHTGAGLSTQPDGEPTFGISVFYIGDEKDAENVLRPLRQFGPPLMDSIGPQRYVDVQRAGDAAFPYGHKVYWKSNFLTDIRDEAIEIMVEHFKVAPDHRSAIGFFQLGGEASRVGKEETAFFHREAQYDCIISSGWTDPVETEERIAWVRRLWDAVQPYTGNMVYVNNLGEEGEGQVKAAYGNNYDRLVDLKNKYDPRNFFSLNQNVKPTA